MIRNTSHSVQVHSHSLLRVYNSTIARRASTSSSAPQPQDVFPKGSEQSYHTARRLRLQQSLRTVTRSNEAGKDGRSTLLRPAVLNSRLLKLCAEGKYDDAVDMLKNAPHDASNAIVWNNMVSEIMKGEKYQLAYQLYTDMKRRQHKPTLFTYATVMKGYARVTNWELFTKQLDNVHNVYNAYRECLLETYHTDTTSAAVHLSTFNMYLKVLAKADQYQKMFDVFNEMLDDGPLPPDHISFTEMFMSLCNRERIRGVEGRTAVQHQNASDARYLWKQFLKQHEKGAVAADEILITTLLRVLSSGRSTDQMVAFDVVREYIGLSKPGEEPMKPRITVTPLVLSSVLELCLASQKPKLCIHFAQQVMDRPVPSGQHHIIDRYHMRQVLMAYSQLASLGSLNESKQALETLEWMLRQSVLYQDGEVKIRPHMPVYGVAFLVFWKGEDWPSAARAFELMSGYHADDFIDGKTGSPRASNLSDGKLIHPDSRIWASMARTAVVSADRANMRQCLRMFNHFGVSKLLQVDRDEDAEAFTKKRPRRELKTDTRGKVDAFYAVKLAEATVELVNATLKPSTSRDKNDASAKAHYTITSTERTQWLALKSQASAALKVHQKSLPTYIPFGEDKVLGSERGLSATAKVVEENLTSRHPRFTGYAI
ncbi:hypothetical protein BDW22DRAFT_1351965 [Trametopsis cervina]|nr:hypothetical protein BDW22DRAFT_1351965 [Trametopsis cervina]